MAAFGSVPRWIEYADSHGGSDNAGMCAARAPRPVSCARAKPPCPPVAVPCTIANWNLLAPSLVMDDRYPVSSTADKHAVCRLDDIVAFLLRLDAAVVTLQELEWSSFVVIMHELRHRRYEGVFMKRTGNQVGTLSACTRRRA